MPTAQPIPDSILHHPIPLPTPDPVHRASSFLRRLATSLATGCAELALPARCAACNAFTDEDEPLCQSCARTVDAIDRPCPHCALALPLVRRGDDPSRVPAPCLSCQRVMPPWFAARVPFAFTGELANAIRRFKLGPAPLLSRPLSLLLAPSLALIDCDAFVPVPLHVNRLRLREFNQSSLLARGARGPHAPPVVEALDRIRDTPAQSKLDAASRHANMRRAFAVSARHRSRVEDAHLCLVDDVLTTGATAAACARTLLAAGARRVDVLALARTLP